MSKTQIWLQLVLPLFALVVSSVVGLLPLFADKTARTDLSFQVGSVTPLGPTQARGFADLRLLKGDKPIERPYLATVRIVNSGELPIQKGDFASPLRITPGAGPGDIFYGIYKGFGLDFRALNANEKTVLESPRASEFVDARVAATRPASIPVALTYGSGEVNIAPLLLNAGDEILVEILVNGGPPRLAVEGRIAGVKNISRIQPAPDSSRWRIGVVYLVLSSTLLFIGIINYLAVSRAHLFEKSFFRRMGWTFVSLMFVGGVAGVLMSMATGAFQLQGSAEWFFVAAGMTGPVLLAGLVAWRLYIRSGHLAQ